MRLSGWTVSETSAPLAHRRWLALPSARQQQAAAVHVHWQVAFAHCAATTRGPGALGFGVRALETTAGALPPPCACAQFPLVGLVYATDITSTAYFLSGRTGDGNGTPRTHSAARTEIAACAEAPAPQISAFQVIYVFGHVIWGASGRWVRVTPNKKSTFCRLRPRSHPVCGAPADAEGGASTKDPGGCPRDATNSNELS